MGQQRAYIHLSSELLHAPAINTWRPLLNKCTSANRIAHSVLQKFCQLRRLLRRQPIVSAVWTWSITLCPSSHVACDHIKIPAYTRFMVGQLNLNCLNIFLLLINHYHMLWQTTAPVVAFMCCSVHVYDRMKVRRALVLDIHQAEPLLVHNFVIQWLKALNGWRRKKRIWKYVHLECRLFPCFFRLDRWSTHRPTKQRT